jgi:hypothetical protein
MHRVYSKHAANIRDDHPFLNPAKGFSFLAEEKPLISILTNLFYEIPKH